MDFAPEHLMSRFDSSKIRDYMRCARQTYFTHVRGWGVKGTNKDLIFGSAWHEGLEVIYQEGYTSAGVAHAQDAFATYYDSYYSAAEDMANAPKNRENGLRGLVLYVLYWSTYDTFQVLHTEVAGSVLLLPDVPVTYRIDAIVRQKDGLIAGHEHKTSTRFSDLWTAEFIQSPQIGIYSHALRCIYPPEEVFGIVVNGAFIHNPPKLKKDGTPYAGSKDTEFHRFPMRKSSNAMLGWHATTINWVTQYQQDIEIFQEGRASGKHGELDVMPCFERNPMACRQYNRPCAYLDVCHAWNNPERKERPREYEERFWDPLNIVSEKATVVDVSYDQVATTLEEAKSE
jgi:hypothetical protein